MDDVKRIIRQEYRLRNRIKTLEKKLEDFREQHIRTTMALNDDIEERIKENRSLKTKLSLYEERFGEVFK